MCGIQGFIGKRDFELVDFYESNNLLSHRGPDDQGTWISQNQEVLLGHRRLSVLELSSKGAQPMESNSGRYVVSYNGEIYNHLDIRKVLEKELNISPSFWRGNSDTETILLALDCWGFEKTLENLTGMFSLAIWDTKNQNLYLARDRIGEKPLYFSLFEGKLYFSSELKPIKRLTGNKLEICTDSLSLFFKYNYIPSPFSIYKNTFKLEAGNFLSITLDQVKKIKRHLTYEELKDKEIIQTYWSLEDTISQSRREKFVDKEEAIFEIERSLSRSINSQLISDVPLGAFLSGGIDSSLVTALMQKDSMKKVKTFTIGFEEEMFDESRYAKKIAGILGTDHTEHIISINDALKIIPNLPEIYDEPFADSSQIPTTLISTITKKHVTVALSGDGGDEFFGGYNRHFRVPQIHNYFSKVPSFLLKPLGRIINLTYKLTPHLTSFIISQILKTPSAQIGDKIERLSRRLEHAKTPTDLYRSFVTEWHNSKDLVLNSKNKKPFIEREFDWPSFTTSEELMMYLDAKTYLPDDIMVKVDRASMSQSLETRAPFLDKDLVALSYRTPIEFKIQNGNGKIILKDILGKYVEPKYFLRPKQGFGIPISEWLKGPLRNKFEELTSENIISSQGFLDYQLVRGKWEQHLDETHDWSHSLWSIFMFQLWIDKNLN